MTTFAGPFNSFANMQSEEDSMEVSNDQERRDAMTMEEDDIFDVDLDLADGLENGPGEDSMMDDEPAAQDGDEEMSDEHQDRDDRDEEILDYVEEQDAGTEIPMTEESGIQQQTFPDSTGNLFNTDPPFEKLNSTSFGAQSLVADASSRIQDTSQAQNGQLVTQDITKPVFNSTLDGTENLESIRLLYGDSSNNLDSEVHTAAPVQPQGGDAKAVNPLVSDETLPVAQAELDTTSAQPLEDHKGHVENGAQPVLRNMEPFETAVDAAPGANNAENDGQAPTQEPKENTGDPDNASGLDAATNNESNKQGVSEPKSEPRTAHHEVHDENATGSIDPLLPVLVEYQGHQMSLFPPSKEEQGSPETFLLPDGAVFDQPLKTFLETCFDALSESFEKTEEIEISFPAFKLTFHRHDSECADYTLRDIAELYVQFQQNDGGDVTGPLFMRILVVPSLAGRLNFLYDLAAESKGMKYVEELLCDNFDDGFGDEPLAPGSVAEDHTEGHETNDHPEQEANVDLHDHEEAEAHDIGSTDADNKAQDDQDFDNQNEYNNHQQETSDNVTEQNNPQPINARPEVQDDAATIEEGDDKSAEALDYPEVNLEAGASGNSNGDPLATSTANANPEHEASGSKPDPNEDAQTAEEIDFDDEWDAEDPTNTDTLQIADAQQHDFEPITQPSESLHSATQPETAASSQPRSRKESSNQQDYDSKSITKSADLSNTSSATVPKFQSVHQEDVAADDEDIFDDEDDYTPSGAVSNQANPDNELDFDLDEDNAKSSSLKRIRSEVDEVGGEADHEEDRHPLKRSRSG